MKKFMGQKGAAITMIFAMIVLFIGCGGGDGTTGSTSPTSMPSVSGKAVVYLTDSFREDFAHVWATIYHVDLIPQSGDPITLFDSAGGMQIDLKTLRDSSGERFSFLGGTSIPQGTYAGMNVTIGTTMQLFSNGAAVGNPLPVDSSIPNDANGHPVLDLAFSTPKTFGSGIHTVIIDFDLARFVIRDSKVLPMIQEGNSAGSNNPKRHNEDDYRGQVSNLSGNAPDLTFTITNGSGKTIQVVTNASTALYGPSLLADGRIVMATGTVDTATGNLIATRLVVLPINPPAADAFGSVLNQDPANGTLTITITRAHGFTPIQTTAKIVTNGSTAFFDDGGEKLATAGDFFANLSAVSAPAVLVAGNYDASANTITATELKIVDSSVPVGWGNNPHIFRPGMGIANWGHGIVK